MSAIDYLRRKEWSMGNGQCPECCGLKPSPSVWDVGPFKDDPRGHRSGCELAATLKEVIK